MLATERGAKQVRILSLATILAVAIGCSEKPPAIQLPTTFPVVGKVVRKSGKTPATSAVEFRSASDGGMRAMGEVQPDGSFELKTLVRNETLPGAVAGKYIVTIYTVPTASHAAEVVTLPEHYTVAEQSNDFVFTIP